MDSISPSELLSKLNSPEGRKLLSLMQKDGGAAFRKAAVAAKAGNFDEVRTILTPLFDGTDAEALATAFCKQFG